MKKISILLAIIIAGSSFLNLKADSPRKVLYEKFTNASCGPCAAQDPAYKGFLANPANKSLIIPISYHVNYPGRDIMNQINPIIPGQRNQFYSVNGVPAGRANGILYPGTSQWYAGAPGDTIGINGTANTFRGTMSPIDVEINQITEGREVTASVKITTSSALSDKRLHIVFVERYFLHPSAGSNGQTEFEYVVREMLVDNARSSAGKIINLNPGENITVTEKWNVSNQSDPNQIYIVAFVQDITSKEILQVASNLTEIPSLSLNTSDVKYSIVDRNSTFDKKVSISNPTNTPVTVNISLDNNYGNLHANTEIDFSENDFVLGVNETKEITATFKNGDKGGYSALGLKFSTSGLISKPMVSSFGFLSKGTKYVVYNGFGGFDLEAYKGLMDNPSYKDEIAFIPMLNGTNFFPTEKEFLPESFDVTIINLGSYPLAITGRNHNIGALTQTILNAGKNVYIASTDGMYYAYDPQGSAQVGNPPSSRNFYENFLGIQYTANVQRFTQSSLLTFSINGVMNDPVGKNSTLSANYRANETSLDPSLRTLSATGYTDVFSIPSNSSAIPCFYYDNSQNNVAGVRFRNPSNGARLVYTSFLIENIGTKVTRDATLTNIMDWLVNGDATSVATTVETGVSLIPNPASIFSTINFQSTSNQAVTISVVDVQGKVVLMNEISAPTIGSNSYSLMTSKLTNGSYTVVVKQGENVSRTPLVVMN